MSRIMTLSFLCAETQYENAIRYLLTQMIRMKNYAGIVCRERWVLGKKTELKPEDLEKTGFFEAIIHSDKQLEITFTYPVYEDEIYLDLQVNGLHYDGGTTARQDGLINLKINYSRLAGFELDKVRFRNGYDKKNLNKLYGLTGLSYYKTSETVIEQNGNNYQSLTALLKNR